MPFEHDKRQTHAANYYFTYIRRAAQHSGPEASDALCAGEWAKKKVVVNTNDGVPPTAAAD